MENTSQDFDQERKALLNKAFNAIAHDLKTPLACIIGSLEIIEKMKDTLSAEQVDSLIKTALIEAHRLDNMVSKILEKAKPE